MVTTFKRLRTLAVGSALALASAGAFADASPFQIDPSAYAPTGDGSSIAKFTATQLLGTSTVLLTSTGGFNYSGTGYLQFASAANNAENVGADVSGLGFYYGMYAKFTQTFSCTGLLATGTSCVSTGITLSLYVDPGKKDTFLQANLTTSGVATTPTVTDVGNNDVLLGTVSTVIAGTASVDSLGNATQTVNTNFDLTAAGKLFFVSPVPFYNMAFSQFGNSSGGALCFPTCAGATTVAVQSESGSTIFNVPEPMPLALMGLGMLGMVALRRKQAKK